MKNVDIQMNRRLNTTFDVELAAKWLTSSGIQNKDGGFYAWYDTEKDAYSFLYPEITGYAVQLLSRIYIQTNEKCYLKNAIKAGDWLLEKQKSNGSFFCKYFGETETKNVNDSFYTFDAGMVVCGFLDLFKITSQTKFLTAAIKTTQLILELQNSDGSFNAAKNIEGNIINNPHWSQTSSCHHTKMVIPLLRMYNITKDQQYFEAVQKLLRWSIQLQKPNGRFVTFLGSNKTYTHAHCYAVEGMLAASEHLENSQELLEKVCLGVKWLTEFQNSDGSFWNGNGAHPNKIKVCDALAQALRLLCLSQKDYHSDEERLKTGFAFLGKMQVLDGNKRAHGGISYGEAQGKRIEHVSSWATIFAVHAALLKENGSTAQLLGAIF